MAQAVVDQVAHPLLQSQRVRAGPAGRSGRPDAPLPRAARARTSSSSTSPRRSGQAVGVGAGEHQQVVGEPAQPVHLLLAPSAAPARRLGVAALHPGHLQLGLEHGERRPQLVAGVGDEARSRSSAARTGRTTTPASSQAPRAPASRAAAQAERLDPQQRGAASRDLVRRRADHRDGRPAPGPGRDRDEPQRLVDAAVAGAVGHERSPACRVELRRVSRGTPAPGLAAMTVPSGADTWATSSSGLRARPRRAAAPPARRPRPPQRAAPPPTAAPGPASAGGRQRSAGTPTPRPPPAPPRAGR